MISSDKKSSINTVILKLPETKIYSTAKSDITTEVFKDEQLDTFQRIISLLC